MRVRTPRLTAALSFFAILFRSLAPRRTDATHSQGVILRMEEPRG
jgi:hypothetical protein